MPLIPSTASFLRYTQTGCVADINIVLKLDFGTGESHRLKQEGRPESRPSPAALQRDARRRRHCGELSWIGGHAAQSGPKVLQRDGCITMAPRINVVNYGPDSSQQKGRPDKPPLSQAEVSAEGGDGRLRRWLPRHLDIDRTSDQDIQEIVLTTNLTPRKCLGFKTPFAAPAVALESFHLRRIGPRQLR
jgi:hypothetical protein